MQINESSVSKHNVDPLIPPGSLSHIDYRESLGIMGQLVQVLGSNPGDHISGGDNKIQLDNKMKYWAIVDLRRFK